MQPVERRRPGGPAQDPLRQVLEALRTGGALTRAELGHVTGLSRTTVSGVLVDLRRRGLVADVLDRAAVPTGGRPATAVALEARAGLAVGVDLGRTHLRVAVADLGHRVLAEEVVRLDVDGHAEEALSTAVRQVDRLLAVAGGDRSLALGVGLGIPAPLDAEGRVGSSMILPGWLGRSPGSELQARLGLPVQVENDANLGALAEALWGAGRGARLVVHVKAATGIGAGIVDGGRIFRGASGTAGEIGHTTVSDSGAVCRCGNRGCLELVAGGPALLDQLRQSGVGVRGVSDLVRAAQEGDVSCRRVLADAGEVIGLAVSNLVNLLNPDVVVFGGELGLSGELVLGTLRPRVTRSSLAAAAAVLRVVPAQLGDRAEALGGVLLVLREPQRFGDDLPARVAVG